MPDQSFFSPSHDVSREGAVLLLSSVPLNQIDEGHIQAQNKLVLMAFSVLTCAVVFLTVYGNWGFQFYL